VCSGDAGIKFILSGLLIMKTFYVLKKMLRKVNHLIWAVVGLGQTPAPYYQKHTLLKEFFPRDSVAIETGTFLGETTQMLEHHCNEIVSFEPYRPLFEFNAHQFRSCANIKIVNDTSENGLEPVLSQLKGNVSFWLDGHFSGDGTFGNLSNASPILRELQVIETWLRLGGKAWIAIDDARLFTGDGGYPPISVIKDFAERNNMTAFKFRDIFFLTESPLE
jgi:hypothetical protein